MSGPRAGGATTLRLTLFGWMGLLVSVTILLGALNTANNLLYLLSAVLFALYPVSATLASRPWKGLGCSLHLPLEVVAGEVAATALRVTSAGRSMAGLVAELSTPSGDSTRVGLAWLAPASARGLLCDLPTSRRGPLPIVLRLSTVFPFGLLKATRRQPGAEVLVLPRASEGWARPQGLAAGDGEPSGLRKGRGQDFLEVRDYQPGDDARDMHWKATARLARPMVRESALDVTRRVTLALDSSVPAWEGGEEAVELAISRLAGAAETLAREGWQLRLLTPDRDVSGGLREVQRALARQELGTSGSLGEWRRTLRPDEPALLFAAEPTR